MICTVMSLVTKQNQLTSHLLHMASMKTTTTTTVSLCVVKGNYVC